MFKTPTRNHFSVIIERLFAIFAFVFIFLFSLLREQGWKIFEVSYYRALIYNARFYDKNIITGLCIALIIVLWYTFISFRFWRKTTFHIDDTDFVYEKQTLFKSASRLPIKNIAVVNIEQNIFERLINTAKVKIDLNSSRTAGSTDFKFVLKYDDAVLLKEELMKIKSLIIEEEGLTDPESVPESDRINVASFSLKEAVIHKILSFPLLQTLFTLFIVLVLPFIDRKGGDNVSGIMFVAFIGLLGFAGSLIPGILNLGNYKVEKSDNMIYISCGMLNKRNYVFESEKINAVIINQPLLARIFSMQAVDLAVVGLGNEKNETTHLSLMVRSDRVDEILSLCTPDFKCTGTVRKCHKAAVIFPLVRAFVLSSAVLLLKARFDYIEYISPAILIFGLLAALCEYKVYRFAADKNILMYSSGIFNKKTYFVKFGDIQNISLKSNIIYNKFGLGRIRFSILGASAVRDHKTGLFAFRDFDSLADEVTNHKDNLFKRKK